VFVAATAATAAPAITLRSGHAVVIAAADQLRDSGASPEPGDRDYAETPLLERSGAG
jgi:hypothetical protein